MIHMPGALVARLRREAEAAYPGECCGFLAGRARSVKEVVQVIAAVNRRSDDPHRYLIDGEEWRRVERELAGAGWEILGYYHSHPDHPAVPSTFDSAHAWPWYSYLIVEVRNGQAGEMTSWVLGGDSGAFQAEPLIALNEVEA
jgi:proteasome lid subunit RPN8/RPN11